jgi:hypothetical protein
MSCGNNSGNLCKQRPQMRSEQYVRNCVCADAGMYVTLRYIYATIYNAKLAVLTLYGCDNYVDLLTHNFALIIVCEFQNFTFV